MDLDITLFLGYRHLLQSGCGELCERMCAGEDLLIMHVILLPREYATQLAEMEQAENIHPYPSAALISPKGSRNKKDNCALMRMCSSQKSIRL